MVAVRLNATTVRSRLLKSLLLQLTATIAVDSTERPRFSMTKKTVVTKANAGSGVTSINTKPKESANRTAARTTVQTAVFRPQPP